jgi:hypothetical protein
MPSRQAHGQTRSDENPCNNRWYVNENTVRHETRTGQFLESQQKSIELLLMFGSGVDTTSAIRVPSRHPYILDTVAGTGKSSVAEAAVDRAARSELVLQRRG